MKAKAMATRRTNNGMSMPIKMLTDDHSKVKKLFREFEKADHEDAETCREIAEKACAELKVHTTIEEEIFYPAVREALPDEAELLEEAKIEHESAKALIQKVEQLEPGTPQYAAAFTVLAEYVQHHIKEEEDEMFPKARKADIDHDGLADWMQTRKEDLQSSQGAAARGGARAGGSSRAQSQGRSAR
jgi:hemerythrin-like domain-containing protein